MNALFSISCSTCQARLKVRSAAAIGQILTCPKCGAMVKVDPPSDWDDPEASQETVDEIDADDVGSGPLPDSPSEPAEDSPILPGEAWESESIRTARRRLMIAGIGVLVLICGGLLVWRIWQQKGHDDGRPPRETARLEPPLREGDAKSDENGDQLPPELDENGGKPAVKGEPKESGANVSQSPSEKKKGPEKQPDEEPESDPPADTDDASNVAKPAAGVPAESDAPPGLKPANDQRQAEARASTALEKLEAMIHPTDDNRDLIGNDDGGTGENPILLRRERNVSALLAMKVANLRLVDYPLIDLPRLVYGVSGVPVTLDVERLTAAGVSLRAPLSGEFADASMADILRKVLQPLGVDLSETPGGIRITAAQPAVFKVRYRLDELPGGSDRAERLPKLIPRWVQPNRWEDPATASVRLVEGGLELLQQADVHVQLRALQAQYLWLRRRQAGGNEKPPTPLDKSLSFVVIEPTPLLQVLAQLKQLTGVGFVVDWESAALVGCEPDVEVTLDLYQRPLGEVLSRLVSDSDLSFRVIDDTTVAIQGAVGAEGVRVHAIPLVWGAGDELKTRMEPLIKTLDPNHDRGVMLDVAGRVLVVRGSDRIQAQVARALKSAVAVPREAEQQQ